MGVSKNRGGPPKWMVKIMENIWKTLLKLMIWGGFPPIFGNIHMLVPPNPGFHRNQEVLHFWVTSRDPGQALNLQTGVNQKKVLVPKPESGTGGGILGGILLESATIYIRGILKQASGWVEKIVLPKLLGGERKLPKPGLGRLHRALLKINGLKLEDVYGSCWGKAQLIFRVFAGWLQEGNISHHPTVKQGKQERRCYFSGRFLEKNWLHTTQD